MFKSLDYQIMFSLTCSFLGLMALTFFAAEFMVFKGKGKTGSCSFQHENLNYTAPIPCAKYLMSKLLYHLLLLRFKVEVIVTFTFYFECHVLRMC